MECRNHGGSGLRSDMKWGFTLALGLMAAMPCNALDGLASWFVPHHDIRDGKMTCASRLWPKNTVLRVTERHNGLSVVVVVDDWGPGRAPTANGVIIDLSPAAFEVLAGLELGHAEVTVEVVDKP